MTHGRNHLTRETSRCRKGTKCIYGFPHPFTPTTWVDEDGHVHYKRCTEEDRWIAPHIPELIDELDCHIFVDVVFTVQYSHISTSTFTKDLITPYSTSAEILKQMMKSKITSMRVIFPHMKQLGEFLGSTSHQRCPLCRVYRSIYRTKTSRSKVAAIRNRHPYINPKP
jgi:hypothetical protein